MILSGHQPCYLPGIQLFSKIVLSDAFMFVGHCQYQAKSWHSHNFIRTCKLSVPVQQKKLEQSINESEIAPVNNWRRKHIKSIEYAYSKSQYFDHYFPRLKYIIEHPWTTLDALNVTLIEQILKWLDIRTKILDGRSYDITNHDDPVDMLIQMCKAVGATEYLSNNGSAAEQGGYIGQREIDKMLDAGITHRWQKFDHPRYGQEEEMNGGRLSVIDLLFRGPEARSIIEHSGSIA